MSNPKNEIFWRVVAVVAVACMVTLTVSNFRGVAANTSAPIIPPPPGGADREPTPVEDWDRVISRGNRFGPAASDVTIVVFTDFKCPFCARFANETFPALRTRFGERIALIVRHWPLSNHVLARPAAVAAECAANQGKFESFHNLLFAQQDALGSKNFSEFAAEAGVPDRRAFEGCVARGAVLSGIDMDIAEVKRIGGTGTPTLVINGKLMYPPYSAAALGTYIQSELKR